MQNKQAFSQVASDRRWIQLTGAMDGLQKDMKSLAPNPHNAGKNDNNRVATGNSRDSMMATMLIDCFFGAGMNAALCDVLHLPDAMQGFDLTTAIDLYDEYWTDRQNSAAGQNKDRTTGGYELGEKGAICGGFNRTVRTAQRPDAWDMYMNDMSSRRALEQTMGGINREMEAIQLKYMTKPPKIAFAM